MCKNNNTKIIARVKNGELSYCFGCKNYNLIYNNLCFQFDKNQLLQFRYYINQIDVDYWLDCYSCTTRKRKIPINTLHQNLILMFNKEEIEDLKLLLTLKEHSLSEVVLAADIDYPLILN